MQPTMTTSDWLRRAADAWSEADATADSEARRVKVTLAEGFERLAKHAAFLAEGDAYPSARKLRAPLLFERLVRGLVALLATPFLLMAVLVIGVWLKASGKLTEAPRSSFS
jgi:hypothetical protein